MSLRRFIIKFYQPNNGTLVVAGDFDSSKSKNMSLPISGFIQGCRYCPRRKFKLPEITREYRETVEDNKAQLPAVYIGYRTEKAIPTRMQLIC